MAVASEPCIFWRGDGAADIVGGIKIPEEVGRLVPSSTNVNGASGRSLDECYLEVLNSSRDKAKLSDIRDNVWLCDIVPHSCMNEGQKAAIYREYDPVAKQFGLLPATVPTRPKPIPHSEKRRNEILSEIREARPEIIVLLGDEPIDFFLSYYEPKFRRLADCIESDDDYGKTHSVKIGEQRYDVLPLVHPRQASKLGAHSKEWYELHQEWMKKTGPLRTESRNGDTRKTN